MSANDKLGEGGDRANPFRELSEILGALNPRYRAEKPGLEVDAPLSVRQIWEAVGTCDAIQDTALRLWSRAESEQELGKTFEQWSASPKARKLWGDSKEAMRAKLPAKLRLVRGFSDEVAVTDETTGADDPPVLLMRSEVGKVLEWCPSYREWLVWHLVGAFATTRWAAYNRLADLPSTPVLVEGYPTGMHRVSDGIWWLGLPALSPAAGVPTIKAKIFYAKMEAYSAYALGLPDSKLSCVVAPAGDVLWTKNQAKKVDLMNAPPEGFRRIGQLGYDGKPGNSVRAIGHVGSSIVWLGSSNEEKAEEVRITFNPQAREDVLAWAKGLGLKVKQDIPLRARVRGKAVSYDYYGW